MRVVARFDDAAAERAGFEEMLKLCVEWRGDATGMLMLGWRDSIPDSEKGLDSLADHSEGEYRMGRVVQALRDDLAIALNLRTTGVERLPSAGGRTDAQSCARHLHRYALYVPRPGRRRGPARSFAGERFG